MSDLSEFRTCRVDTREDLKFSKDEDQLLANYLARKNPSPESLLESAIYKSFVTDVRGTTVFPLPVLTMFHLGKIGNLHHKSSLEGVAATLHRPPRRLL